VILPTSDILDVRGYGGLNISVSRTRVCRLLGCDEAVLPKHYLELAL